MTLSFFRPALVMRSLSTRKALLKKSETFFALLVAGCSASLAHADATFSYELIASDTEKMVKNFSVARFFVRIDDPARADHFHLFQAGKFFPMYAVDQAENQYTLLTPPATPHLGPTTRSTPATMINNGNSEEKSAQQSGDKTTDSQTSIAQTGSEKQGSAQIKSEAPSPSPAASPDSSVIQQKESSDGQQSTSQSAADAAEQRAVAPGEQASDRPSTKPEERWPVPTLKPTKKKLTIAGVRCRVVHELLDGQAVREHCMANSAALGVTKREVITMSRLFAMARKLDFDWLGTGTKDEEFISVQSRDLDNNRTLLLTAVSTEPLPAGYLRIPRSFERIDFEAKADSEVSGAKPD